VHGFETDALVENVAVSLVDGFYLALRDNEFRLSEKQVAVVEDRLETAEVSRDVQIPLE
jgi:hypothetical protein